MSRWTSLPLNKTRNSNSPAANSWPPPASSPPEPPSASAPPPSPRAPAHTPRKPSPSPSPSTSSSAPSPSTPAPRCSTSCANNSTSPAAKKAATTASAAPAPSSSTAAAPTACLTLAVAAQGYEITTIEGLGDETNLHPVQAAFLEHDGYQCGYCTPGQICSATALLEEQKRGELSQVSFETGKTTRPELTDEEIRERMSGNICRCGAYPNIVAAVRAVAQQSA